MTLGLLWGRQQEEASDSQRENSFCSSEGISSLTCSRVFQQAEKRLENKGVSTCIQESISALDTSHLMQQCGNTPGTGVCVKASACGVPESHN